MFSEVAEIALVAVWLYPYFTHPHVISLQNLSSIQELPHLQCEMNPHSASSSFHSIKQGTK